MSIYVNAIVMLAATLVAFVGLARLVQAARNRRLALPWSGRSSGAAVAMPGVRLAVEQACAIDSKRRLVLARCDDQRVLLLTGGPADLVVCVLPPTAGAGA
jgi:hypothetical protein